VTEIVEKRRHPRVAADFALDLKPATAATVRDISRAGVRCVTPLPMPPMTVVALRLEIPAPGGDGEPCAVNCAGVVVWNRVIEHQDGPMFEAAILFQDLAPAAEEVIERFVRHRLNSPAD
jgi:hypothetical protein